MPMNAVLLYPFILFAGALQAAGNSMNARLRVGLVNPWLAATVSFALIVFVFLTLFFIMPTPLPSLEDLAKMPWWAPLGGIAGAVAVFGGLAFVDKVGAGPFNGLLITANILTSLCIDQFGWFGMQAHSQGALHWVGAALMVGGIALIAKF
jgi:transporter family-2 protein